MSQLQEARNKARQLIEELDAERRIAGESREQLANLAGNASTSNWDMYCYTDRIPMLDTFIRYSNALGFELALYEVSKNNEE